MQFSMLEFAGTNEQYMSKKNCISSANSYGGGVKALAEDPAKNASFIFIF